MEKTKEVIFSTKRTKSFHPPLSMDNIEISCVNEHKHLSMTLDSQLNFQSLYRNLHTLFCDFPENRQKQG